MGKNDKKPLTWTDIENSLRNSITNSPGGTDPEKLAYFKKKIIAHLDTLQEEEDKKVIPFSTRKKTKKRITPKSNKGQ